MSQNQAEIIRAFVDNPNRKLTINQISKTIGRSYSFTNINSRQLIEKGILKKEVIGHSILCSLNLSNDEAIGLLVINSIRKKNIAESKEDNIKNAQTLINDLKADTTIHTAFLKNTKLIIICKDEFEAAKLLQSKDLPQLDIEIIGKENFSKEHLENPMIIFGFEEFWRLVAEKRGKADEFNQ